MSDLKKILYFFLIFLILNSSREALAESYQERAKQSYYEGVYFREKGDIDQAINKFEKSIELDPSLYQAYFQLSQVYVKEKCFEKAELMLKKVNELNPYFYLAYLNLGICYLETKQYNNAKNAFEKVLGLESNNFDAHYNLGNLYIETGDFNRAKDEFEKAAFINPNNKKVRQNLDELNKKLAPNVEVLSNVEEISNNLLNSDHKQPLTQVHTLYNIKQQIFEIFTKYLKWRSVIYGIIFCTIIILPFLINYLKIRSYASKDYKLARGTQHLKQIKASLKILNKKIRTLTNEKNKLEHVIEELEAERSNRLYRTLSTRLVQTRLHEVEGIGPKLRNAIINQCFKGTIDSLQYAYRNVKGVGQQKQWAINRWISMVKSQLYDLLEQDFPGKEEITNEYEPKIKELKKRLGEISRKLKSIHEIKNIASSEQNKLSKVKICHFIKAHRNRKDAALLINEYLKGIFPEWSPMPIWYKILISEYGG